MPLTKVGLNTISGINDFETLKEVIENLYSKITELEKKVAELEKGSDGGEF